MCNIFDWVRRRRAVYGEKYRKYNARELSEHIISVSATPLHFVGINILSDCRLSALSGIIGVSVTFDFLLSFYTTYYYWNINVISAVQHFSLYSVLIPVNPTQTIA